MKKGQKKRRSVILRRVLALLLAIVLIHSQIMPAVFAADTNYSQESNTEEKTVVDGAETVLPMSEDTISEPSEPIQSEEQQTEDKVSEDTTVESSEPIQSGEQQTEDTADAEQSPEVETTGEAAEESVNIADAVVPVTVNYYLPKSQNLQVDAPESYTEGEAQEEAKSAVIEQALGDETTQKLIEQQKEKGIESNTQELTASAVSEEEYDSYTQMAVTGEGLQAPEVSLSDDVQLEEDADAENTNPLIGWQVAKTAGIMLSYTDGTEIKMGDVIPADRISEVQMTAADDGISLLSTQANMSIASLIALTQDMTVVQRVGDAGTNGKWSVLVQGGTNQTPSAGTVRHAYGTLKSALTAISADTTSSSFKITFLDDYTADSSDLKALGNSSRTGGELGSRTTNKPTIVFTGAVNYTTGTSYSSWTTFTSTPTVNTIYFSGFNAYFTHINLNWTGTNVYGNQNNTTFDDVKFVGGAVTAIYGGGYSNNSNSVSYTLTFKDVEMTKDAPVKQIFGGGQDASTGTINLTMTNCTIYGNVYASSGPYGTRTYTHTGSVYATLRDTAIRKFDTTVVDPMLKPSEVHNVGGSFWGLYGKVTENLVLNASGSYVAECGTWFTAKQDCQAGSISYIFNDIKESLRFVGAYEYAGYDQETAGKGYIEVNNTQVANVFGWGYLELNNSATCDQSVNNFGHMQYDSSFYNYWTEQKKQDAKGGDRYVPKDYKPDLPTCIGYVTIKSSTICSGGDCYEAWNRQRFGGIVLKDNYNTFQIYNAMGGNSTNVVDVYYLMSTGSASYKATIELMAIKANATASDAFSMIRTRGNYFQTSVGAIGTLKTHANVPCTMAQDPTNRLIKLYATANAENIIYLYSGNSNTGTALYSANSFAAVLDFLRKQPGTSYTLWFTKAYSLIQKDVTAFNDATGFTNKNVTIVDAGLSGSHEQASPNTGVNLWGTVYPQFKSLTWKNAKFRSDFLSFNKYPYVMHGNGHNLTFENCTFAGDVTINAGGNGTQGTSGSTLTLKNCVNVNKIYASKQRDGLGNTTINVESCTGYTGTGGGFITIDPAYYSVKDLEINLKDCSAKVAPSYIYNVKVSGNYRLTAENTQLMFNNPNVSSGHTAKVYLNKDSSNHEVVLLGDCKGSSNAPAGSSSLYVTAKVRPKDATSVNLDYFDQIEINGGELHLGDSAELVEGGFGSSSRAADVSLKNEGKLMLDYLSSTSTNRTINSLTTDDTGTEVSVTYNYKDETSPSGRPLIIKNTLQAPTRMLRISTTLPPRHKGTVEYPLVQFNSSNNAKLEQYNWIADEQYYLAIGSRNSNQIVLRADTYAPLVYQAKTTNMSLNSNGSQSGQLEIYLKDLYRDGIDKNGNSIHDASDGAYPTGVQVYLSTQDVQLKDGVYGYTYNSSTDLQLKSFNVSSYGWMNSGSFTDINGKSVTATTKSPVLHLKLNSRTYQANTNYFIYARDIAGNWSKFLLDTKGPTSDYTNITSTKVSDGTYSYTFTGLKFTDPTQTATYGTSDIADVSYKANATQYIQSSKKIAEVRYNKTGLNPWAGNTYTSATVNSSTGACTLSNVSVSVTEKLYVFVKDGYGNISRFTYVPIVFDAQSGGATSTGKFSDGSTTSSTLGLVGSTLKSAQVPSSPVLGNQTFCYWYNSTNSGKSQVFLTSVTVSSATTYYPQWTYPTLTISNQITGSTADKSKIFTYTIAVNDESGTAYSGKSFSYTGGTVDGETGVTAPANGIASSNSSGEIKISLSHGQKVTIQLPGYYDQVKVTQSEISTYWTTYTTEADEKFNSNATENPISVNATNRSLAFVNSNDSSQPVIYQQKMEGEWTKDQGDNYGRKLTVYIRDLYGDGIDTNGSSFSTEEKAEFPGSTYAQVYLSTYDAPKADRGYNFRYNASESVRLESLCSCKKLTTGSFTDIEGNAVAATLAKPAWEFKMLNNYTFDQNKNYFIYVRDLTGKWTKYLLDTKGPSIENTGIITTLSENDTGAFFQIANLQFMDEVIVTKNGTSSLTNESDENFTYNANATMYQGMQIAEVRNNKTGKFSDTYRNPKKETDGSYTAGDKTTDGRDMFYVYVQDYYGNTTAAQYVQVSFDATGGGLYKKVSFEDGKKITRRLVVKGDKLTAKQIPANPGFYNNTTEQKFTQWSDSTDANKKKVDLKTAQMTKSVILNADYDKPSVIIKQMIKGDGIWNNQEFTYKVKTSYPKGKVIPCKGSYVSPAVNAPNITSLTVDANQEITFKLKAGQSLELIPGDNQYTIKSIIQVSNGTNCEIQKDAKVISSVENVAVDEISTNFVFTNTKNIVVTGVDGGNTDNSLLLVGLMGVLLITGVSVLRVRGRRRS